MKVRELIEMLAKEDWDAEVRVTDQLSTKCRSQIPEANAISTFRCDGKPVVVIKS